MVNRPQRPWPRWHPRPSLASHRQPDTDHAHLGHQGEGLEGLQGDSMVARVGGLGLVCYRSLLQPMSTMVSASVTLALVSSPGHVHHRPC
jgi:hypothetical protein